MSMALSIGLAASRCATLHSGAVDRPGPRTAVPPRALWPRTARNAFSARVGPCTCITSERCPQHHRHAALGSASTSALPAYAAGHTSHGTASVSCQAPHASAALLSSLAPRPAYPRSSPVHLRARSAVASQAAAAAAAEAGPGAAGTAQPLSAAPSSPSQLPAHQPQHTSGLGQVIAASSNFVRVQLYTLLPDSEPTPNGWRPPHMRDTDAAPAASGSSPGAAGAADTQPPASVEPEAGAGASYPVLLCSLRSLLRKLRQDVVVGDVVRVEAVDWVAGRGAVSEVLPRSSRLTDPAVANVEHALLVFALDTPPFEEQQVSRFLVAYEAAGVSFSLVLNKADLVAPEVLAGRLAQCRAWGYEPVVLSCETGEGVEQVAARLSDRVSVVAGPSGAGKSSLINLLRRGRHRPDLQAAPGAAAVNAADEARALAELERAEAEAEAEEEVEAAQAAEAAEAAQAAAGKGSKARGRGRAVRGEEAQPMPIGGVRELVKLPPPGVLGLGREAGGVSSGTGAGASEDGGGSEAGATGDKEPEFLAVGALSKMGRGMHTTTSISLLRLLGGGWLADTPGFGQPTLDDIASPQLAACFPEISDLVGEQPCRFSDCLHVAEPGCAVRGAGLERYAFYLRFLQDIRTREANDVTRLQRARADREGYAKAKSVRGGGERMEARLDSKRHRRTSRQGGRRAGDLD